MRRNFRTLRLLWLACFFAAVLLSCDARRERLFQKSRILMDTVVTVTVVNRSEDEADKAIDHAFAEIERLANLSDFFSPGSEVSKINGRAGLTEVTVAPDIVDLIGRARYVSENTGGAFDVTVGPLISLYDFRRKIKPGAEAVKKALRYIDYRDLIVDRDRSAVLLRRKGMSIDLGGIAKGYAADRAVEVLRKDGIASGLVAVAGDIRTFGRKPDGKTWRIGIRDPRAVDNGDDVMASIELTDMAISTSGDYERFFFSDGIRYHHLLSPFTGYPAHGCRSVSVITKEGALSDAFATAVFVLGPAKGMKVLQRMGFEGIIVDNEGEVHITPGMRGKLEFRKAS